jgi:hypothetical protein
VMKNKSVPTLRRSCAECAQVPEVERNVRKSCAEGAQILKTFCSSPTKT